MDPDIIWILAAIVLVIVELLTGTFSLLVLGLAATAGAALAWFNLPFPAQATVATIVAVLGVVLVHRYRVRTGQTPTSINAIDVGQRVTVESWVNEAEGLARVHYRGTLWDAKVIGDRGTGTTFYIRSVDGSTLHIAPDHA